MKRSPVYPKPCAWAFGVKQVAVETFRPLEVCVASRVSVALLPRLFGREDVFLAARPFDRAVCAKPHDFTISPGRSLRDGGVIRGVYSARITCAGRLF